MGFLDRLFGRRGRGSGGRDDSVMPVYATPVEGARPDDDERDDGEEGSAEESGGDSGDGGDGGGNGGGNGGGGGE